MDELKDKFKSLFSKASDSANKLGSKKFAGQGHRLGTAEEQGIKPKVKKPSHPRAEEATVASSSRARAGNGAQCGLKPGQQQLRHLCADAQAAAAGKMAASPGQPAPEPKAFSLVEGQFALQTARGTTLLAAAGTPSAQTSPNQPAPASPAAAPFSPSSVQPSSLLVAPPQIPVTAAHVEQMQVCLAMITSQPDTAEGSLQVLSKLLANLLAAPQEAKYRHIRLSNPKIHSTVVQVQGALEFLSVVGFEVHAAAGQLTAASSEAAPQAAAAGDDGDGFAVFFDDRCLGIVQEGMRQLQLALPVVQAELQQQQALEQQQQPQAGFPQKSAAVIASTAAAAAPVMQRDRHTQVLLPAVPATAVPDWFFDRTGAEVKAEYMARLKQRQTGELMASKAWKDAQLRKQGQGPAPTEAIVRVRFPEGVCLQGQFHVSEPLGTLFEWVTAALRSPAATYELVGPNRKPLPLSGKIGDADLVPAVLLNFRPLSHLGQPLDIAGVQQSFLKDELLQQAKAD